MSRGVGYVQGGTPYHVTYPMMHVMLPTLPPPPTQTDACENITFPQLRLWAVKMSGYNWVHKVFSIGEYSVDVNPVFIYL